MRDDAGASEKPLRISPLEEATRRLATLAVRCVLDRAAQRPGSGETPGNNGGKRDET